MKNTFDLLYLVDKILSNMYQVTTSSCIIYIESMFIENEKKL